MEPGRSATRAVTGDHGTPGEPITKRDVLVSDLGGDIESGRQRSRPFGQEKQVRGGEVKLIRTGSTPVRINPIAKEGEKSYGDRESLRTQRSFTESR